jgi:hypothetical protein
MCTPHSSSSGDSASRVMKAILVIGFQQRVGEGDRAPQRADLCEQCLARVNVGQWLRPRGLSSSASLTPAADRSACDFKSSYRARVRRTITSNGSRSSGRIAACRL